MRKYAIATRSPEKSPVLVFVYVQLDLATDEYVGIASSATGERGVFLATSAADVVDKALQAAVANGYEVVQGPVLIARSRVKVIRWGGNTIMVSFKDGALITDPLLDALASARNPLDLPALLLSQDEAPPDPVRSLLSRDETLVWDAQVLENLQQARRARDDERLDDHARDRRGEPISMGEEWAVEDRDFWIAGD